MWVPSLSKWLMGGSSGAPPNMGCALRFIYRLYCRYSSAFSVEKVHLAHDEFFLPTELPAAREEFTDNVIRTAKYTLLTFVPLNLWEQFRSGGQTPRSQIFTNTNRTQVFDCTFLNFGMHPTPESFLAAPCLCQPPPPVRAQTTIWGGGPACMGH